MRWVMKRIRSIAKWLGSGINLTLALVGLGLTRGLSTFRVFEEKRNDEKAELNPETMETT
jgi:hypothetical protein